MTPERLTNALSHWSARLYVAVWFTGLGIVALACLAAVVPALAAVMRALRSVSGVKRVLDRPRDPTTRRHLIALLPGPIAYCLSLISHRR